MSDVLRDIVQRYRAGHAVTVEPKKMQRLIDAQIAGARKPYLFEDAT